MLKLLAGVQARERGRDAATVLVTEVATQFACDRVSLGFSTARSIEMVAQSHQVLGKGKQARVHLVTAAMEEAALQKTALCFPEEKGSRHIMLAHRELARRQGAHYILTVPLARNKKVYGAMTCERGRSRPFLPDEVVFMGHVAALLGPVIELKCDADKPLWQLVARSLGKRLRTWSSKSAVLKLGVAAGVLFIAMMGFLPVQYRVSAPARLEGTLQRALAAPTDGFLKQVHVRPGDEVKAGQVLAELSDEEFKLEQGRRQSEVAHLESSLGDALAKHDYSQIGVLAAKVQEAKVQLELVGQQLQRTRIEAPFEGVILKGDLMQSVGAPVRQGDALFVLAPLQGHRVILEVDERDIADVALGKPGALNLAAYPSQTIPFSVKRITAMAVTKDGRNYFEAEAAVEDSAFDLRPGLQGVAKVDVERRALGWVLGHDAWNWLRLKLWSWIG
ncbi:MAG: HlyD family efflux transporter periplasmic adaptor subunit [Burkholderiales bacterium]